MSTNDDSSSSTFKSYVDSAVGAAQGVLGSVTGNPADQAQADTKKTQAQKEFEASHSTAKIGPITADPNTGAATRDDPNRSAGSWNQTVGAAKESIGNFIGNENLRQQGIKQNSDGKGQEAQGQLSDLGQGISDRAQGALGSVGAAITGDREGETKWRDVHDEGKTRQRGVETDLQKGAGN